MKEKIKHFLEDKENLDVPGNSLLIYHKGKEIFRHVTGDVTKDTIFRIYSMTKVVTVTAALQLYEQGKYQLEDPVSKYIPSFVAVKVWDETSKKAVPASTPVLVKDLICMTAGLSYEGNHSETAKQLAAIRAELEREHPGEGFSTLSYVTRMPEAAFAFQPGSRWQYSLCHDALGGLIEVWSGQKLGEYMEEHIFRPLGMKHTFFRCPKELMHLMATHNGTKEEDAKFMEDARYESGGGGLLSTVDDYMRFAEALTHGGTSLDGVKLLEKETVDLMRKDQLNDEQKKDFNWSYLKGYSYGLGVRTMISPGTAGIPGNLGEFGWCGVLGTWVLMDPAEELTVVYMHQRFPNLEEYVQTNLRKLIYPLIRNEEP